MLRVGVLGLVCDSIRLQSLTVVTQAVRVQERVLEAELKLSITASQRAKRIARENHRLHPPSPAFLLQQHNPYPPPPPFTSGCPFSNPPTKVARSFLLLAHKSSKPTQIPRTETGVTFRPSTKHLPDFCSGVEDTLTDLRMRACPPQSGCSSH